MVRGLLCNGCNTGLGSLGDDEAGLVRALAYILRSKGGSLVYYTGNGRYERVEFVSRYKNS